MANGKPPQGAFRAKNGVWCVKKKCERCGRGFTVGLALNPKHCKGCRQVLKNRKYKKTDECRQWESRAKSEYSFDERAALKQGVRRCHDCGKPSGGNYRCAVRWSKIRGETVQRTDGYYVYV